MNLYGFAGGDRINFSDPMGLCPWTECLTQGLANWGAQKGGAVGNAALNVGAGLAAAMEATGINAAAEAGDALGRGKFGSGGIGLAMAIVPLPGKGALRGLIRDAIDNPRNWKTVGALVESATNRKARGGVSIQRLLENDAGDRLVEHTVLDKAGKAIDGPHFRGSVTRKP